MRVFKIEDVQERFNEFSDLKKEDQITLIRCVLDCIKWTILDCKQDDRVMLFEFGTYVVSKMRPIHGKLRNYRTKKIVPKGRNGLKVKWIPCKEIKEQLKEKSVRTDGKTRKQT